MEERTHLALSSALCSIIGAALLIGRLLLTDADAHFADVLAIAILTVMSCIGVFVGTGFPTLASKCLAAMLAVVALSMLFVNGGFTARSITYVSLGLLLILGVAGRRMQRARVTH